MKKENSSNQIQPMSIAGVVKNRKFGEQGSLFPDLCENPWLTSRSREEHVALSSNGPTCLELCAGAGGQALGYDLAGFQHMALVELDRKACDTLRLNRPEWQVFEQDLRAFSGVPYKGVDVICGGLPCPPFSVAGKQLGIKDERNLFPELIRLVDEIRPRAVQIENVRGILDAVFLDYREYVAAELRKMGYQTGWKPMYASDFGVPQLRPRVVFVAVKSAYANHFEWPAPVAVKPNTVGEVLLDLMASNGWPGAAAWSKAAGDIAPTVVGGSHKHGGPDLGPTRARQAWASLGVDGLGIANEPPHPEFAGMPRLTVRMVARIQGFPDEWAFCGGKTASYRQVGNAFPPPFARAVASSIRACLTARRLIRAVG